MFKVSKSTVGFGDVQTFHGITDIQAAGGFIGKSFWLLIFSVCSVITIIQLFVTTGNFLGKVFQHICI